MKNVADASITTSQSIKPAPAGSPTGPELVSFKGQSCRPLCVLYIYSSQTDSITASIPGYKG